MKVSIIVNSYKGTEAYLKECLDSIKAQVVKPHEVIVVVDGFAKPMMYPGVTTIIRDNNIGIAASRDEGVRLSTGNYLLFVDADDCLPENFLQEIMAQARWSKADIIYPNCLLWSRWGESKLENAYWYAPFRLTLKKMMKQNYVVVTSLIKRKVYEKVGGFNPDLILFEDYDFFFKALLMGFKFSRANCYLKYRQRTESRNRANGAHKERVYRKIKNDLIKEFKIKRKSYRISH